jgi:hypothetical protein
MSRAYFIALLLAVLSASQLWPADEARRILTPPPPAEAKINGPTVYGARPGHPFLYRIPCTGERHLASPLPEGVGHGVVEQLGELLHVLKGCRDWTGDESKGAGQPRVVISMRKN